MDPQELLALFGATQPQEQPADLESIANQVYGPAPNQGYDQAALDFQPQTYYPEPEPRTVDAYGNPMAGAPQTPPPVQPPTSKSQSASHQGYSPQKAGQINAGPYGKSSFDKTRAGIEQGIRADYADELAGQQGADQAQLQAADQVGLAETEQISARARLEGDRAKFLREQEQGLRAIYESGNVAINQAKNEYLLRLASIPEVNPNALWDEAGAEGQFQMGVAAVIHNMLGVKGINTTAMDTINTAIKNKIAAQIENINTKKYVASGFKDLWDATVAESGSRMEAEAKMHGYMLKAFEAGIDAEMGKVDSNVARAKHAYTKAQLQQAQIKNRLEVENHIQTNTQKAVDTEAELYRARLQASVQREGYASNERIASGKQKEADPPVLIPDLTKSGGGMMKWKLKPVHAGNKDIVEGVTQKVINTTQAAEAMAELSEIQAKIDKGTAPALLGQLRKERDRLEEAARGAVVWALTVDVAGKRATDKDYDRISAMVPAKGWFTNGNNRRIIAHQIKGKLKEMNLTRQMYMDDLVPGEVGYGTQASQIPFGEAETIAATNTVNPPELPNSTKEVQGRVKAIGTPESAIISPPKPPEGREQDWKEYTIPYWKDFNKAKPKFIEGVKNKQKDMDQVTVLAGFMTPDKPPAAFDEIRELAEDAYSGVPEAQAQLYEISAAGVNADVEAEALAEYANYFLEKMETASGDSEFGRDEDKPVVRPR
jgi:hypothetical protein